MIPAGVYRLGREPGSQIILSVQHARDLEIAADDVTLVCMERARAVDLRECQNVVLHGLTVDYDPLPFTQGEITAIAADKSWVELKLHAGYPKMPWRRIDLMDRKTRFRKRGGMSTFGDSVMQGPDVVRVPAKPVAAIAQIGDLATLSTGNDPGGQCHGIEIHNCLGGIELRNVTLHAAPGMGIVESHGAGGTRLIGVKIVLGPKPPGATEERLLTTSWDGICHSRVAKGPVVEDCLIEHCGDDSWSVTSRYHLVLRRDGNRIVVAEGGLKTGDRLLTSHDSPAMRVVAAEDIPISKAGLDAAVRAKLDGARRFTLWAVKHDHVDVLTLDRSPPLEVGDSVFCPDRQGNGFVFRNNRIYSSGRVLIEAGDGLVEGNVFRSAHCGVWVCPEIPGEAADTIRNLVIRNNRVIETGYFASSPWTPTAGAICIAAKLTKTALRPPGMFENIIIEGNTIDRASGPNLVVTSTRNVLVKGNQFLNTHQTPPGRTGEQYHIDPTSVIWMSDCENVRFEDNLVQDIGPFAKQALTLADSVKNVAGAEAGVQVRRK